MSEQCMISEISITPEVKEGNPVDAIQATGLTFQIYNPKLYAAVVTLFINDNIKFLENIEQGFKRETSWNKYWSEITTQTKTTI